MTNIEFADKAKNIANNYKTLYVMGGIGFPMTASRKSQCMKQYSYNAGRASMINSASADTFGFDCVGLIKAILWGWNGNKNHALGGAEYACNGVADVNEDTMITKCSALSTDFNNIEVGEAVWQKGHIGIYIGDGLAVEATPAWKNCVQITACNCNKAGYNKRSWTKHGKLPWINYVATKVEPKVEPKKEEAKPVANEVTYKVVAGDTLSGIASKYGTTYQKLAQYNGIANPNIIHVGQIIKIPNATSSAPAYDVDKIAKEVIRGDWGNGADRKIRLTRAGYDYAVIQSRVNEMLK